MQQIWGKGLIRPWRAVTQLLMNDVSGNLEVAKVRTQRDPTLLSLTENCQVDRSQDRHPLGHRSSLHLQPGAQESPCRDRCQRHTRHLRVAFGHVIQRSEANVFNSLSTEAIEQSELNIDGTTVFYQRQTPMCILFVPAVWL